MECTDPGPENGLGKKLLKPAGGFFNYKDSTANNSYGQYTVNYVPTNSRSLESLLNGIPGKRNILELFSTHIVPTV